ncbi:3-keto-5-aminohexanoate cleavage enzyme [Pantoea sp. VS1]|uniref:3-keto-5-aminohexanoate cleavage protein n=1 Tax=Pantoea sp. VS1 TaxID=2003658 RepID=UPI000B50F18C|nr:3-keto-5-aminohexanoate cleavage protein [Pantoea sp. VS1]OWS75257.1 3-keto-5-aminohexanoate cleavage enzyme [Pantoea sp. VS1]
MILQACINGARTKLDHPSIPVTSDEIIADALACVAAGAHEIHVHPRSETGAESLGAVDTTVSAIRLVCPGTLIGVSTGDWIEGGAEQTRRAVSAWKTKPDYASVNLSETGSAELIKLLIERNIGVEAGLSSPLDAEMLVRLPERDRIFRVLIEIEEQQVEAADSMASEIVGILKSSGINKQILLHGFDATAWHFIERAKAEMFSTRIGLEDCLFDPDGGVVGGNADMILMATRLLQADR